MHPTIISRHFWPQFQAAKILMPGQLHAYAVFETILLKSLIESRAVFKSHIRASLLLSNQTRNYDGCLTSGASVSISSCKTAPSARTFHLSKQHLSSFSRKRVWFPYSVNVNLFFLTLISEVWTVNDLVERVGPIERPAALKALLAWVDRGVLREENDGAGSQRFRLLESAPTDVGAVPAGMTAAGSRVVLTEEQPAVLTVQQQQAEQMKVYWKVRFLV
jgi:anaphase-promoting complex subunit 2